MKHEYSIEKLYHFRCHNCNLWWSIADFHILEKKETITCPHCGTTSEYKDIDNETEINTTNEL